MKIRLLTDWRGYLKGETILVNGPVAEALIKQYTGEYVKEPINDKAIIKKKVGGNVETKNITIWDFEGKKDIELTFQKAGADRWKSVCCFHQERKASLFYYESTGSYICYGCGRHGVSSEKYLHYIDNLKSYNLTERLGDPVASYPYKDEEGKILYQKFRFEKRNDKGEIEKTYRIWKPDGKGGWIRNIQEVRRVIYNLDKINNSSDKVIFLLEGEKDCDNLMTKFEGVLATTSDIGAGRGIKKWRPEYYEYFQDREVIIIPDNDRVSKIFYRDIGNNLVGIAKSIKYLELPELPEHGDISDWLMKDNTLDSLFELIKESPKFPLPVPVEDRSAVLLSELWEANLPKEEMIINGIMGKKNYTLIASGTKKGKTLFSLNLALNLISGTSFLETYPVNGKQKVMYVYSEASHQDIEELTKLQVEGLAKLGIIIPKEDLNNLLTYNIRKELLTISLKNDDLSVFQKVIDDFKPDVIIIDPVGRIATFDMNKDVSITLFANLMIQIRDCHWVLVHHTRKGISAYKPLKPLIFDPDTVFDSIRGSSCWSNYADTIIALVPSGEDTPPNYLKVFFRAKKGFEPIPLEVKWDFKTFNYELNDITDLHKKVKITYSEMIEYLKSNFGDKKYKHKDLLMAISQVFKITPGRVGQLLVEAKDKGDMAKDEGKFGRWYISDQGKLF